MVTPRKSAAPKKMADALVRCGSRPHPKAERREHEVDRVRARLVTVVRQERAGENRERNQSMQAVGETPRAIEGQKQTHNHGQRRWQPRDDFAPAEQRPECSDQHVVKGRQGIGGVTERRPDGRPSGKLRDADGEELVEPEETMGRDVDAGDEIEGGQQRRHEK